MNIHTCYKKEDVSNVNFFFDEFIAKKVIWLPWKGLRDDELDVLIDVIMKSTVLETLNLCENQLTLADGKLTAAIAQSTIKELDLTKNNIGVEGAKKLANAIKHNCILKKLWLDDNNISDEGTKILANMLMYNNTLQEIDLSSNNISDEGAKGLATSFKINSTLKDLRLKFNRIGDEGAKSMATSFKMNTKLNELCVDLGHNRIGDEGAEKLADALKYNNTIEIVQLYDNNASEHAMQKVADATERASMEDEEGEAGFPDDLFLIARYQKNANNRQALEKIASLEAVLRKKNGEIASLKESLKNSKPTVDIVDLTSGESEIVNLEAVLRKKNKEITSLKESLKNSKPIVDIVDLTSGESEPASKRPRTEDTAKSNLAIMHEQTQKMVQVKQEKNAVEATLEAVQGEKEAVEANLEEVKEDLEDSNELAGQLTLTTNVWQGRFDELVSLVQSGGRIDGAMISEIRNRPLLG